MESIAGGTLNFLEVIRYLNLPSKLFSAGSTESYGDLGERIATEETAFRPQSPYAVAKSTAYWQVANYRQAYNLYCCTGILSNHESPLRGKRFVTQKIIQCVKEIKQGLRKELRLGNLDIWRDWGWAQDYVEAMHLMLQNEQPKDYLIATGKTHSLLEFVELAFKKVNLNHHDYLISDKSFFRPSDLRYSAIDPSLITKELGWQSKTNFSQIVERMFDDQKY